MKLTLKDLDGIKLISDPTYFMEPEVVRLELENAYMQGSQGWGVRREVGVYLALARDLKIAMELAATADNAQRMLKGAQLEGGRLRKRIKKLEAEAVDAEQRVLARVVEVNELDAKYTKALDRITDVECQLGESLKLAESRRLRLEELVTAPDGYNVKAGLDSGE